jgi:hypothetical protein
MQWRRENPYTARNQESNPAHPACSLSPFYLYSVFAILRVCILSQYLVNMNILVPKTVTLQMGPKTQNDNFIENNDLD